MKEGYLLKNARVIVIVMDGVGIGEMPDSALFNDSGSNSLGNVAKAVGGLHLPMLTRLGLGNSVGIQNRGQAAAQPVLGVPSVDAPLGFFGKMKEVSPGKDSIYGHWELMGCVVEEPFPLFPNGFPADIMQSFAEITGKPALGNVPASGTKIIDELGQKHMDTGRLIVYTSADSVFQIAAHEAIVPPHKLYEICKRTRALLNPLKVGRVVARPFIGAPGKYTRTKKRRDYSLTPPKPTLLEKLVQRDTDVIAFGKIDDLFASRGITRVIKTGSNREAMEKVIYQVTHDTTGLLIANCNDTDTVYGHRRDPKGYSTALEEVDNGLSHLVQSMSKDDLLVVTADHGCDPTFKQHTDHTREYVPILAYTPKHSRGASLGLRTTFADVGATVAEYFDIEAEKMPGTSFLDSILP